MIKAWQRYELFVNQKRCKQHRVWSGICRRNWTKNAEFPSSRAASNPGSLRSEGLCVAQVWQQRF